MMRQKVFTVSPHVAIFVRRGARLAPHVYTPPIRARAAATPSAISASRAGLDGRQRHTGRSRPPLYRTLRQVRSGVSCRPGMDQPPSDVDQ